MLLKQPYSYNGYLPFYFFNPILEFTHLFHKERFMFFLFFRTVNQYMFKVGVFKYFSQDPFSKERFIIIQCLGSL